MKLCVTGGAGYIGSVVAQSLLDDGNEVCVVDNLTTGHKQAIPQGARFVQGDIRDDAALKQALGPDTDAILHFAALSVVSDSVERPLDYFHNNVGGTIQLLEAARKFRIKQLVFSSSAAVYGEPQNLPIQETDPCNPTNPYGTTKFFVENILKTCSASWGLRYVSLRYFNAGGSTDVHGEDHEPESHLIPVVLDVALGKRKEFTIFGDDYDTADGTCIRDYIHVKDLASAHVLALQAMQNGFAGVLNLGSETVFTVMEVVETVERVTGKKVTRKMGPRRPGDPPALQASSKQAEQVLKWTKSHSSLEEIVRSAYQWRQKNPNGYDD